MTVEVDLLVRDYAEHIDSLSTPVDIGELLDGRTGPFVRRPRAELTLGRAVAVGLAAFAVVLVGAGLAGILRTVTPVLDAATPDVDDRFVIELEGHGHNLLVFDPAGWLVVTDHPSGPIVKVRILSDGSAGEVVVIPSGHFDDLSGLTADDEGVLYFNDFSYQYRAGPEFAPPHFARPIATGGRFSNPGGLAVDSHGDLYIADGFGSGTRITRVELPSELGIGTATEIAIVPGNVPEGWRANDIDFGPNDELFVLNHVGEVWTIMFDSDRRMRSLSMVAAISGNPAALAVDATGTLYVGTEAGVVWSVNSTGEPIMVATGFGSIASMALGDSGTLYLVEGSRVSRLLLD
jgi:sugar lactone lactonase YvrE